MITRKNIAKRIEQLEQARRDRQPREPLQAPDWLNMKPPTDDEWPPKLNPGELPWPIWMTDDE